MRQLNFFGPVSAMADAKAEAHEGDKYFADNRMFVLQDGEWVEVNTPLPQVVIPPVDPVAPPLETPEAPAEVEEPIPEEKPAPKKKSTRKKKETK